MKTKITSETKNHGQYFEVTLQQLQDCCSMLCLQVRSGIIKDQKTESAIALGPPASPGWPCLSRAAVIWHFKVAQYEQPRRNHVRAENNEFRTRFLCRSGTPLTRLVRLLPTPELVEVLQAIFG